MPKKIDPAEMPMEDKLKNLYLLQTTLSEIDKIKQLRGELPLEVQDLEDEIAGLTTRVSKMEEEIAALEAESKKNKGIIEQAQLAINRYNEQINNVANNREYDLLKKELEFQELEVKVQQKHIDEATAKIHEKKELIDACQKTIAERTSDLDVKKAELEDIVAETRMEEEKLREKSKGIEATIEPRLLASFKRIRHNSRNGLGMVYVQRDSCGGCFNKIPPQRQLDIRMRKKVIVCEYCGRILIDPELAGMQTDKPVEEKPKRKRSTTKKAATAKKAAEQPEEAVEA
ncbi:MAG: hypothetical protein IJ553_02250 [Alloprevotella sp.]|nr:hypothetical protein [Alloprevotella sp.]